MFSNKSLSTIKDNKMFAGVDEKDLSLRIKQHNLLEFPEGKIVYQNGDKSEFIYLICQGTVKLKINTESGRKIFYKKENDFFGEIELLKKTDRNSSAVANIDCLIYKLFLKEIIKLTSKYPAIKRNLSQDFNSMLKAEEELTTISSVEEEQAEEKIETNNNIIPESEEAVEYNVPDEENPELKTEEEKSIEEVTDDNIYLKPAEDSETSSLNTKEGSTTAEVNVENTDNDNEEILTSDVIPKLEQEEPIKPNEEITTEEDLEVENTAKQLTSDLVYLYRSSNTAEAVTNITELAKNFSGAEFGKFFLIDNLNRVIKLNLPGQNEITVSDFEINQGLAGYAASQNEIINIPSPRADQRYNNEVDFFDKDELKNILCFPIRNNVGDAVALLQLAECAGDVFTSKDEKYIEFLSPHILNILAIVKRMGNIAPPQVDSNSFKTLSDFMIEDINGPVSIIKKYASFIQKQDVNTEVKQVTDFISIQAENISDFSTTVSDFLQNKKSLLTWHGKINNVLNEILAMLAEYVEQRDVKIYKKYETEAVAEVDKIKLFQAFYQLVKILCAGMREGGNIYLIADAVDNKEVRISLKGSAKIIKDFLNKTTLQTDTPLNISYLIADKIINDHDGKLNTVQGENEEMEFQIFLPVTDKENPEEQSSNN